VIGLVDAGNSIPLSLANRGQNHHSGSRANGALEDIGPIGGPNVRRRHQPSERQGMMVDHVKPDLRMRTGKSDERSALFIERERAKHQVHKENDVSVAQFMELIEVQPRLVPLGSLRIDHYRHI
jgi:hypothetical protein